MVHDILCDITPNEHNPEFWDVFINDEPRQKLLPEWIVRGAITRGDAITTAKWAITELLQNKFLIHDSEGRILSFERPTGL